MWIRIYEIGVKEVLEGERTCSKDSDSKVFGNNFEKPYLALATYRTLHGRRNGAAHALHCTRWQRGVLGFHSCGDALAYAYARDTHALPHPPYSSSFTLCASLCLSASLPLYLFHSSAFTHTHTHTPRIKILNFNFR